VQGTGGPPESIVVGTLRTADGHLRARFRTLSDAAGMWQGCFNPFDPIEGPTYVNQGDRLTIEAGSLERLVTIPPVNPMIDRVADTVRGHTKPNSKVVITVFSGGETEYTIDTDETGKFFVDTSSMADIRGGDYLWVYTYDQGDEYRVITVAPYIAFWHGNEQVTGYGKPGRMAVSLTDADGNLKGTAALRLANSFFRVPLVDDHGLPVYPLGGDWMIGNFASDARLRVPFSQLTASAADNTVTGRCMANAPFVLVINGFRTFQGTTDSTGRFFRDLSGKMNIRRGHELRLRCDYKTGDVFLRAGLAL